MHPDLPHDMEICTVVGELLQQMMDLGRLEVSNKSEDEQHVCMQSTDVEIPKKPKPLVIHFTRGTAPQQRQKAPVMVNRGPSPFPYKSNKAVPWRYAPPKRLLLRKRMYQQEGSLRKR